MVRLVATSGRGATRLNDFVYSTSIYHRLTSPERVVENSVVALRIQTCTLRCESVPKERMFSRNSCCYSSFHWCLYLEFLQEEHKFADAQRIVIALSCLVSIQLMKEIAERGVTSCLVE